MKKKESEMDNTAQYYEKLLARIREIRASEKTPRQKVADIVKCAIDYDAEDARILLSLLYSRMAALGPNGDLRFANCMIMHVEHWAECHFPLTMKDFETNQRDWLMDADNNQHIYEFPSFCGNYEEEDVDEENNEDDEDQGFVPETYVTLPKELEGFKGGSMILKIEDMDRLIDTFCSRNTYYRRAYAILADLDKEVLESLEEGVFKDWIWIDYKEFGDAMFQFSHFEVDLREPDSQYRTLYVVYRYDTTVS